MKRLIGIISVITLALILFPSSVSAHWGDGDGHFATAIFEWGIILGSLGATFYLVFIKKPVKNNNNQQQQQEEDDDLSAEML